MMWNAISNMIIKAADNMNRGVENAGTAGEGNNGQDYQIKTPDIEGSASGGNEGYTRPAEQETSGTESITNSLGKISDMGKNQLLKLGNKEEEKNGTTNGEEVTSDERLKNIFGDNLPAVCLGTI